MVSIPRLQKTVINSVNVSSYVMSWGVDEEFGQIFRKAVIGLKNSVSALISFNDESLIEKSVTIQRGIVASTEEYVFQGYVESISFEGPYIIITCYDKLGITRKKTVNKSYDSTIDSSAGVISEIFKDLINNYANLTANNTSVQNSGSVLIRKKFTLRRATVFDACNQLAEMIDWQFYYNPDDDLVYFEPKGYTTDATVLTVGGNINDVPKWSIDSTSLFNKIIVKGVTQNILTSEGPTILNGIANANWNTTGITLLQKPVTTRVYSDASNPPLTEKTAGVQGASATYHYTVDKDAKKITWNTAQFAPTTSYYAKVDYTYELPTPVSRQNNASITQFGKIIEKSVFKDDLKFVDDVAVWAQKQVDVYGFPFKSTTLNIIGVSNIKIGRVHTVVDSFNGINDSFLIQKVSYKYPFKFDQINIGDLTLKTGEWSMDDIQRLKRLEEKQNDNEDILNQFIDVEQNVAARTQWDINTATPESGVLYWDDDNQGDWGNDAGTTGYNWGDDTSETQTLSQRLHSQNVFFEDFWDDDFVYTNWTSTTDTTTATGGNSETTSVIKGIKFTANTACQLVSVAKLSGSTITRVRLSDTATGSGTIFATATFSGNTATFSVPYQLQTSTTYYLLTDNSGSSYTSKYSGSQSYPQVKTNLTYVKAVYAGADHNTEQGDFYSATTQATSDGTTASVSTTAHSASFIAGQTFRSITIFKYKDTNITTAKITIPISSITGSVTLYLSCNDGSNWESVSNGTTYTFTNTGKALKYRIDSAGTSSIALTNVYGESVPLKIEVNI